MHYSRNEHGNAKSPLFVVDDKTFPHDTVEDVRRVGRHLSNYAERRALEEARFVNAVRKALRLRQRDQQTRTRRVALHETPSR